MLHRQRHSSCAVLPRVTPPPGLVADAKFRTQTRFQAFAYAEAASKLLLDETIVLQDDFPGSGIAIACDGTYSFWF